MCFFFVLEPARQACVLTWILRLGKVLSSLDVWSFNSACFQTQEDAQLKDKTASYEEQVDPFIIKE